MPDFGTPDFHNVLLAGSRSSGKTTLAEALLFHAGETSRQGTVDGGTTTSDFEPEEQAHHYSVYSALMHATHQGKCINLLDLPGAPDFIGQAIACLPAAETMVLVMDPEVGVDSASRRLVKLARSLDLPIAIVVSHIDGGVSRLGAFLSELQEAFGRGCLPINLPANNGKAVIDCLLNGTGESDLGPVAGFHTELLDRTVEIDDALMERYLDGEEPNYEALHEPFERAMDQAHVIPVCFTDALSGVGVDELLDIIVRYFPSPPEGNRRPFFIGEGDDEKPFVYSDDADKPLLARVFHIASDPYLGKLCFFRVYQGKLNAGDQLFVGDGKRPIRVGHLFQTQGKQRTAIHSVVAGDVGAIAKVDELHLGDVLHDDHALDHVHHRPLPYPKPLHGLAVVPKTRGDEDKIAAVLARIREEDPTFEAHFERETRELVIHGLGEMHLSLVIERIKNQGVDVETKPPRIAYHETITGKADGQYRHKKQSGGAGQFGEVSLRVEPLERGQGLSSSTRSSVASSPRTSCLPSRRGSATSCGGASSPVIPSKMCASPSSTGRLTRSTARKSPSRPPEGSRSRKPSSRPSRIFSNLSSRSRSPRPASTWGPSRATFRAAAARSSSPTSRAAAPRSSKPLCRWPT
ncbi:MAG: GTP-binding protein [Polyangiales bacterium]